MIDSYVVSRPNISAVPLHLSPEKKSDSTDGNQIFLIARCHPPTPVADLQQWTVEIRGFIQKFQAALSQALPKSLNMKPFTVVLLEYDAFLQATPKEICVGETNKQAAQQANAARQDAMNIIHGGISRFEATYLDFERIMSVLLSRLYNASLAVNSATKDFSTVTNAVDAYNSKFDEYEPDVYELSEVIIAISNRLAPLTQNAETAMLRAYEQIETNVEGAAQTIDRKRSDAEAAFIVWDKVDGKNGYESFSVIKREVQESLVPDFARFRVPNTERIAAAIKMARLAVNQVYISFNAFPNFTRLPDSEFEYKRYGSEDRKYGGPKVISALQAVASAYKSRTTKLLSVGDLQYEHGGKMGKHKSHQNGIDADVDGVEIGNIPNHDPDLALALAKDILSAGAKLVFYADSATISAANKWAEEHKLDGRLQFEADHTKHFHLRMPW